MATATVKPVEPIQRTVLLELTEDEATTLLYVSHHIGGSPTEGRRGHVDSIRQALCDALSWTSLHGLNASRLVVTGFITLEDETTE